MRSCNSRIPEEYLVCYQTSQHNWVIIKMLYRYLRGCLLSWHGSRSGFVTPCIREVSLGPLGNIHHKKLASKVTKELVTSWCITERVKKLAGNEIEQGMKIPTIESRASNLPMNKGNYACCHKVRSVKIFTKYVGTNMGIQGPYWLLTREVSRSCIHSSRTRRVRTLNIHWRYSVIWVIWFGDQMLFGVPNEITDMTRSSGMVRK